jgi:hypothetical protein
VCPGEDEHEYEYDDDEEEEKNMTNRNRRREHTVAALVTALSVATLATEPTAF